MPPARTLTRDVGTRGHDSQDDSFRPPRQCSRTFDPDHLIVDIVVVVVPNLVTEAASTTTLLLVLPLAHSPSLFFFKVGTFRSAGSLGISEAFGLRWKEWRDMLSGLWLVSV
jgi:hypothetical protein